MFAHIVVLFSITFLYKLTEGAAKKSYGLNVARLAEVRFPFFFTGVEGMALTSSGACISFRPKSLR